jgi:hypothetical protein
LRQMIKLKFQPNFGNWIESCNILRRYLALQYVHRDCCDREAGSPC